MFHFGSPKLTIELVPSTAWYKNVRSNVTADEWDLLKRNCYSNAKYSCEICYGIGDKWPVECHEVWEYDDINKIQKLIRLIALCPKCHEVKHIGLAELRGNLNRAIRHLAQVNSWSVKLAKEYVDFQFLIWADRSKYAWKLNIDIINNTIKENIEKETW